MGDIGEDGRAGTMQSHRNLRQGRIRRASIRWRSGRRAWSAAANKSAARICRAHGPKAFWREKEIRGYILGFSADLRCGGQ